MTARGKAREFNPQMFLETLTCFVFACLLLYLTISGKYLNYLTPRMRPYLYFAAVVLLVWAASGASRVFSARRLPRCAHCAVLLIPALLIALPHRALGASDASFGYITGGLTSSSTNADAGTSDADAPGVPASPEDADLEIASPQAAPELAGLDAVNRRITINDTDYYLWICEIYDNLDVYVGFTVSVTGYVLREPDVTGEDEFIPARLMMACCAADLVACGLVCRYDGAAQLADGDWVTVEGVLEKGKYMEYDEARIAAVSVRPADPIESFVYMYS
jgi:putative membrane protein